MKFKSLFALALTLATIGLSLPAVAGDRDGHNNRHNSGHNNRHDGDHDNNHSGGHKKHHNGGHNYYGKYQYYKMGDSYIHVGSHGDYFDSNGGYHDDHPEYAKYYSDSYDYKKYSYYEGGKYYAHN